SAELAVVAREPLLRWLVESAVVTVFSIERILAAARARLLDMAVAGGTADEALQRFACALARQCYINEYVFSLTDEEGKQADQLTETVRTALAGNAPVDPFCVAVIAAYRPL